MVQGEGEGADAKSWKGRSSARPRVALQFVSRMDGSFGQETRPVSDRSARLTMPGRPAVRQQNHAGSKLSRIWCRFGAPLIPRSPTMTHCGKNCCLLRGTDGSSHQLSAILIRAENSGLRYARDF